MAEDPFGRKGEQPNPFGEDPPPTPGALRSGDPLWAGPTDAPPSPPRFQPPRPPTPAAPTHAGGFAASPKQKTNGKATAALVLGILGLPVFCPLICSIPALILGYGARREIARTGEGGAGQAKAAIVMGWIGTVVAILAIIAIVVFALAVGDTNEFENSFQID